MKPRRFIGMMETGKSFYLFYRIEGDFPTWEVCKHYTIGRGRAKDFIRLTVTGSDGAKEGLIFERMLACKVYVLRFRSCPECKHKTLACTCHAAFWRSECKHVKWIRQLDAQARGD